MPEQVEREVQRPCGWCGQAVTQPGGRQRLRRYCSQSCRQRAYEDRRAAARRAPDWQPPEQAERIVEVQPRYPHTVDGWERALTELAAQVRRRSIGSCNHTRLALALDAVRQLLHAEASGPAPVSPVRQPQPVAASRRVPYVGDDPVLRWLTVNATDRPTTLRMLADALAVNVERIRTVLIDYVAADIVIARRITPLGAQLVDVATIPDHAKFTIFVR